MSLTFSTSLSMTGADLSAALRQLVETDVTAAAQRRSEADEIAPAAAAQDVIGSDATEAVAARPTPRREAGQ